VSFTSAFARQHPPDITNGGSPLQAPAQPSGRVSLPVEPRQAENPPQAPAQSPLTPEYLSQLLGAIPMSNPSQIGGLPQIQALMAQAAQSQGVAPVSAQSVNPALVGAAPSTGDITSQIMAALSPQFSQQNQALTESLANAGIVGGSTGGAVAALGNQQQQQAMAQMAPYIMQGLQMQQTRDLANQGATNQGNQFNSSNALQAAEQNQSLGQQNNQFNTSAQNDISVANQGANLSAQGSNQGAALQGGEFNANQQNAAQQFDIGNLIKSAMYDTGNYNQMAQYLAGIQNQDWLAQLGAQSSLAQGGAGAQAGAFNPVFQQPQPVNFGGLGAALAPTPNIGAGSPAPYGSFLSQSGAGGLNP
jgi:hypothetical protein